MAALELTQSNFQAEVMDSDTPVLIDLWAEWCGPCRMVAPVVDELATEYAGRLKVAKLNVDDEPALAGHFGVSSIPMIVIVKGGEIVSMAVGARPKRALVEALQIDDHVAAAA